MLGLGLWDPGFRASGYEDNQDTLRRRVALPASAYESVLSIKIPDFFENVASLEDLRSAGLAAAAALCQHQPWGKAAFSGTELSLV